MTSRLSLAVFFVLSIASFAHAQPAPVESGTVAVVITPCVALVHTQSIETPFVGTWEISGGLTGTLTVSRKVEGELTLAGKAGDFVFSHTAPVDGPRTWRIPLDSTNTGIANNLDGSNHTPVATRFLIVNDAGKGDLKAISELKGKKTKCRLIRKKEALIVYGTHENGMKVFAQQCEKYYRAKGYTVTIMGGQWQAFADALLGGETSGHTFQRVVVVGHGGWDGPMFQNSRFSQISSTYNGEDYWNWVRAMKRGTTLDAKYIVSACHSGGANRYETWRVDYRYTDEVAKHSGRTAYGVNGSTSTEWSKQLCMFAEGEGGARQESRVSGPGGGKTVMGGSNANQPPISNQPLGTN